LALTQLAERYVDWTDEHATHAGIQAISEAVHEASQHHPETTGMRTTLAGLLVRPDHVLCFNVGDSRAYRITDGYIEQVSTDDAALDPDENPTGRVTPDPRGPAHPPLIPHVTAVPLDPARPSRLLLLHLKPKDWLGYHGVIHHPVPLWGRVFSCGPPLRLPASGPRVATRWVR
jgi:protein phosphatase